MAKRESQGLQIALILVVMLAVLLAVTTILFWNQATKATAAADAAKTRASEADQGAQQKVGENQTLKEMLGYPVDESLDNISANHQTDMVRFGQYAEEQQNYRELPKFLDQTIQTQLAKINEQEERIRTLEADLRQLSEDKDTAVKVEKDGHDKAGADLLATRNDWTADRDKIAAARKAAEDKLRKSLQDTKRKLAQAQKQIETLQGDNRSLDQQLSIKNRELVELRDESFEVPDGEITWVNQRGRKAYINLGSADYLKRQVTFSVYDVDANGIASSARKGSIEIVRIVDDHLAEARITDDSVTNPIVSGDIIYSPVWQAGSPTRFALTGFMDIDGDGTSDRERIKRLIAVNGGVVDAEVDDRGQRSGEISINTRYLVLGSEASEAAATTAPFQADQALRKDAKSKGLTTISVDRLLEDLGYQRVSRAVAPGELDTLP